MARIRINGKVPSTTASRESSEDNCYWGTWRIEWHYKQLGRFGTLWVERFKSVLVEDQPDAVQAVAAYVDLNSVRAGQVSDPKDYRWCGYAEAAAGHKRARQGLASFHETADWAVVGPAYRQVLMATAGRAGRSGKVALDGERFDQADARGTRRGRGLVSTRRELPAPTPSAGSSTAPLPPISALPSPSKRGRTINLSPCPVANTLNLSLYSSDLYPLV